MEEIKGLVNGVLMFTNWTGEDFVGKWNSKAYTFPAEKTSPMIIEDANPIELRSIRKKFAKDLAEREFFKSEKFKGLNTVNKGDTPALYVEEDLAPFIQKCLNPLPVAHAEVKDLPKIVDVENNLKTNSRGRKFSKVIDGDTDLSKEPPVTE